MRIVVNGLEKEISDGASVAQLLEQMEQNPKYLAVERNKILIPRSQHAACLLAEGDQLEIVTLVGGG